MPKKTSRPFANLLRSWGWRGGQDDQGFGLAPVVTPVVIAANEPEALPRFWAEGYVGVVGAVTNLFELLCPVDVRVREIFGAGQASATVVFTSGADLITANIAAVPIGGSTGQPSRATARTGTLAGALPATIGRFLLGADALAQGTQVLAQRDPWILPAGRRLYVAQNFVVAGQWLYSSVLWEELGA